MMDWVAKISRRLARADIAFYLLIPLMIILVIGTIAQRQIGLHAAQQLFFNSTIFYAITGMLTLSLALKFLFYSRWKFKKSGVILSHLGALILLLGGFVTAINAKESYLLIPEGQTAHYMYDYIERRLFIFEDDLLRYEIPAQNLKPNTALNITLPFKITILESCVNCNIQTPTPKEDEAPRRDLAQHMQLHAKAPQKEPEENLTGATFRITEATEDINGRYIAFEHMPRPINFTLGGKNYKIILGRSQRQLPFSVKLVDFVRETYPGTQKAKAYYSDIVIEDGATSWPTRIEMNKPLRYKGYTIYQSSFEQSPEIETAILSVVQNKGYAFPYIGTILMAIGLILHIFLTLTGRRGRR